MALADLVLWSGSFHNANIWPALTILSLILHTPSPSCSGVQGDQSCLWAGSQPRKARTSLSACHYGNMPALPPSKSSTISPPNSGRQNGKGLLDQSIPAPPLVPSGETEAQEGRDGVGLGSC